MLAATAKAAASDWYVDKHAATTACTQPAPCKTINEAVAKAGDGDTIHIAGGLYTERVNTAKRLTFVGSGVNVLAGGTQLQGDLTGDVMNLSGGGAVRDMAVVGRNTTVPSGSEDVFTLNSAPGTGPPTQFTLDHVFALAGEDTTTNNDPGRVLFAGGGSTRAIRVHVVDSTLTGQRGNDAYAVKLQGDNSDSRFTFDRVDLDAGSEQDAILAFDSAVVVSGGSIENAAIALELWRTSATLVRARVSGFADGVYLAEVPQTLTARDSLISSGGRSGNVAIEARQNGGTQPVSVNLDGSTVVARGQSPAGALEMLGDVIVHSVNTAFRAIPTDGSLAPDVRAEGGGSSKVTFTASHSYYGTVGTSGATLPPPGSGTNVGGLPGFTDPSNDNYTLRPTSPLVDRGDRAAAKPGELDVAGAPRSRDGNGDCLAAPDIGAYERPGVTPCKPPDRTAPTITRLRFKPHRLRAGHRGKASLRLSERATLTVTIQRRTSKHYRKVADLSKGPAGPGAVKLRIGPKVKGKKLRPGRYRLVLRAADATGNLSKARRVGFRVVRAHGHG